LLLRAFTEDNQVHNEQLATAAGHVARGIDHVGVAVKDIADVTRFYVEELGLVPDGGLVELPEQEIVVQFLRTEGGSVELLMPLSESGPLPRLIAKRGEGLHHICFAVSDIHGAVDRLNRRNVVMADPEPWQSPHGWAAFLHPSSAHGCAIELREYYK
jgi:methylmalonyl-CoA epimerase